MKKMHLLLSVFFLISQLSCQKSQFSTVTRHSNNGKVTYINHYRAERVKKVKVTKTSTFRAKSNTPAHDKAVESDSTSDSIRIEPLPASDTILIASTSNIPVNISSKKITVIPSNVLQTVKKSHQGYKRRRGLPDTLENMSSRAGSSLVRVARIKFKSGNEEIVKIIYQSSDTIKYHYLRESDAIRTVTMDKVESILPDPRKTEKFGIIGFILSILGLVPVFGLPFSILAIVFGARSLRRIHKFPERFKGKGLGITAIIIGTVSTIVNFIFIIISVSVALESSLDFYII